MILYYSYLNGHGRSPNESINVIKPASAVRPPLRSRPGTAGPAIHAHHHHHHPHHDAGRGPVSIPIPRPVAVPSRGPAPALLNGVSPDADVVIRRHKVEMSPDRRSYETSDTTEIHRRRPVGVPRPTAFGPPPLPAPLMKMLTSAGVPLPPAFPLGPGVIAGGPKPMFMVIKRVVGGPGGPDGPGPRRPGPAAAKGPGATGPRRPAGPPSHPPPEALRNIIKDKITAKGPRDPPKTGTSARLPLNKKK